MQEGLKLKSMLEVKCTLSPDDVRIISESLLQYPRSKPEGLVRKLTKGASQIVSAKRKDFEAYQSLVYRSVQSALGKHSQDKASSLHDLLFLCYSWLLAFFEPCLVDDLSDLMILEPIAGRGIRASGNMWGEC
jgi:hypothetical protein